MAIAKLSNVYGIAHNNPRYVRHLLQENLTGETGDKLQNLLTEHTISSPNAVTSCHQHAVECKEFRLDSE